MDNSYKLIEEGRKDELWAKHCGFLSLSRDEFKDIQKRLMLEQIKTPWFFKDWQNASGGKNASQPGGISPDNSPNNIC